MRVSNSKVKTWRRCPNQYRYRYVMKLRPRARRIQLERGSWMHELLQVYYDGESWEAHHKMLTKKFYNLMEEEREEMGDLPSECELIMRAYLRTYANEDEARFITIDSELDEIITLPNGLELNVIIDLVLEDTLEGGLWIVDHKFRKSFGDADDMMLDPQLTLYFWAIERMGYTPLRGAMYNEVRTKPPSVPALLQSGHLSQRKDIDTDVWTYMNEIRKHRLDPTDYADILQLIAQREKDRFFRRTRLPKDKPVIQQMMKDLVDSAREMQRAERDNAYPHTFDLSCKWGCDYKNLCIAELHGADISSMIKSDYRIGRNGQQE